MGFLMPLVKIIVEKHPDGLVAYPVGMRGVVVGEGDTYEEAVSDVTSAIRFHIETFGKNAFSDDDIVDARLAEVVI
jgi:predicted RNase H-like HicB family nuclease